jgi:BirA family transcriptional regulator, biotin operon repressor / biotin---[acetyl-CoA-carboxylase] ligase
VSPLGHPRVHYRVIGSTNARARELAGYGAPHGTVVTAGAQSAGRGRQGRTWTAAPGRALLCSIVIRDPPRLLPLVAGVAVAEVVSEASPAAPPARLKWPNDVLVDGRKVAGILAEGRPQEGWAVVGVGLNVALRRDDFPVGLRENAATLGLEPDAIESMLTALLGHLEHWIGAPADRALRAVRERDALLGQPVRWAGGRGTGGGVDEEGRLLVATEAGTVALDAGEVHLVA